MAGIQHLARANWLAAGLHTTAFVGLLVAYRATAKAKIAAQAQTFRYQYAGPDAGTCSTQESSAAPSKCNTELAFQQPQPVAKVNVIYGALGFFAITAFAHTFYATDGFGSKAYSRHIAEGWNPYRWVEYAMSASVMAALIGIVDGTRDMITLLALALITAAMQFNGYVVEAALKGRGDLSDSQRHVIGGAAISGWVLFATLWTVLLYSFFSLVQDVKTKYGNDSAGNKIEMPKWIWGVVFSQLAFFASFGVVQWVHMSRRAKSRGRFDYAKIETMYIVLSFVAKLALAGGLSYGLIFRVKDCP